MILNIFFIKTYKLNTNINPLWLPQHKKDIKIEDLQWFLGFVEGSSLLILKNNYYGNINMLYFLRSTQYINILLNNKNIFFNKKNIFKLFKLEFNLYHHDPQLLYKIRKILGFGKIITYTFLSENLNNFTYYKYQIKNFNNITRLILLLNNSLVLNKMQNNLKNYIIIYNFLLKFNNNLFLNKKNIKYLIDKQYKYQTNISLFKNGWFAGYTDALGCFNVSSNWEKKNIIKLYFFLNQKNEFYTWKHIFNNFKTGLLKNNIYIYENFSIQKFILKINFNIIPKKRYIYKNSKIKDFLKLFNYFNKYPFKSKKNISYIRFCKIWNRLNDQIIRKKRSFKRLKRLINSI